MVRSVGAQLGLLAFGVAILAGLYAGNSPATILLRALVIMVAACATGQALAWAGKQVLRDHLQHQKLAIDQHHQQTVCPTAEPQPQNESSERPEPRQDG